MKIKQLFWLTCLLLVSNGAMAQKYAAQLFPLNGPAWSESVGFFFQPGKTSLLLAQGEHLYTFQGGAWSIHLSLPKEERITNVHLYHDTLWIGTESGRCWFFYHELQEAAFTKKLTSRITAFEVHQDQLWLGTHADGLFSWSTAKQEFIAFDVYKNSTISALKSFDEHLWIGTDQALHQLTFNSNRQLIEQNSIISAGITSLYSHQNKLYIGRDDGQLQVWPTKQQLLAPLEGDVQKIWQFRETLFVLDARGQLWRNDTNEPAMQPISIEINKRKIRIFDFFIDERGFLWLSTPEGIASTHLAIENLETFNGLAVQAICEDRLGNLWLGTPQGLFSWPKEHKIPELVTGTQALNVLSLFEDKFGRIWIGTFGQGLHYIDASQLQSLSTTVGLSNSNVFSMDADTSGNRLFLGTLGGVFFIDLAQKPIQISPLAAHHTDGPGTYYIYQVLIDHQNRLWIATDGLGVYCFQNNRFTRFNQHNRGTFRIALGICEDATGNIWVNSLDGGLLKIEQNNVTQCFVPSAKPRTEIAAIAAIGEQLLIQYDQGISMVHLRDKREFYLSNLLPLMALDGVTNSVFLGKELFFGKIGGVTRIHQQFLPDTHPPDFSVQLMQPTATKSQRFGYDQNTFRFQLNLLWPLNDQAIYKRYRLHPLQKDWVNSFQNDISFQSLRPGDYELEIEISFFADFKDANRQSARFFIAPPFYQTWWFLLVCTTLIAITVWQITKANLQKRKLEANYQIEQVRAQYEQLRSQVSPHFLFNAFNTLLELIDQSPKKATTYVEQLSYLFRSVLTYKDADLITLEEELKLVSAYIFLQQQRFGSSLRIEWQLAPNQKKKLVIPMGVQLLIENAIKHNVISAQKPLLITISSDEHWIVVRNNLQTKAVTEPSTGFGLSSLKTRYEVMFKQTIPINQSPNHFEVKLPLIDVT